ncbi:MAG: hypothetical protein IJE44_02490 [Clostridia bacterium]|nr:hypothetical protein [Clostridia bacterium]
MDKDRQKAKERVKALPLKEKIKHYWGYYKFYVIGVLLVAIAVGTTVYQKITEPKPDLEVLVFADETMAEEMKAPIKETIEKFAFEKNEELFAEVILTEIPFHDASRYEELQGSCAKLMAELSLGQRKIYILDQTVFDYVVKDVPATEIWDENYSFALGENAKKALGLKEDKTYYYLTQILYGEKDKDKEDNAIKFEYMAKVYEGLHDIR